MIIRYQERVENKKQRFNGNGSVLMREILNQDFLPFKNIGRLFSEVVLNPGESFGFHRHTNEFEVIYVIEGKAKYYDNDSICGIKEGDVCVCENGNGHGVENIGDRPLRYVALVLNAR